MVGGVDDPRPDAGEAAVDRATATSSFLDVVVEGATQSTVVIQALIDNRLAHAGIDPTLAASVHRRNSAPGSVSTGMRNGR